MNNVRLFWVCMDKQLIAAVYETNENKTKLKLRLNMNQFTF